MIDDKRLIDLPLASLGERPVHIHRCPLEPASAPFIRICGKGHIRIDEEEDVSIRRVRSTLRPRDDAPVMGYRVGDSDLVTYTLTTVPATAATSQASNFLPRARQVFPLNK